jgi:transcriptional regulator with XRE-family HTH domain
VGPLNRLLKQFRLRIDPDQTKLGPYERLPWRRGRAVTQEELAQFLGVSRTWYAELESNAEARTSPALLNRVAVLLMVTPQERAVLFCSAFPELELARPEDGLQLMGSTND